MINTIYRFLKRKRWARHLFFWFVYTFMMFFFNLWKFGKVQVWGTVLIALLLAGAFYSLFELRKKLADKRTRVKAVSVAFILLILLPFIAKFYIADLMPAVGGQIQKPHVRFKANEFLQNYAISFYRITGYAFMFFLYRTNQRVQEEKHALELKRLKTDRERATFQMRLYRAQIYPHFQRNTLQSIINRINKSGDAVAVEMLRNLMEVSTYSLKYSQLDAPTVFVERELDYLNRSVDLIRQAAGNSEVVQMIVEGEISGQVIPPLCLPTFIENVWKHGMVSTTCPLLIHIRLLPSRFEFFIKNFKKANRTEPQDPDLNGFGLKNIQYRLYLIFGERYNLSIEEEENTYAVKLTINYGYE